MKVRPIGDRILVEEVKSSDREQQTASGIILPDSTTNEAPKEGKIIALGEGRRAKDGEFGAFPYAVGTTILFTSGFSTQKIKVDNKDYLIITDADVLGVIE